MFDRTAFNGKKVWEPNVDDFKLDINDNEATTVNKIIDAIVVNKNNNQIRVTNQNADIIPYHSGIGINANEQGLIFSWTGYDGNNYETKCVEWKDGLSGDYTINLKNYIDYNKYPNFRDFDLKYSFTIDNHVTKDETISFLNGKKIDVDTWGSFSFQILDENNQQIKPNNWWWPTNTYYNGGGLAFEMLYEVVDFDTIVESNLIQSTGFINNMTTNDNVGFSFSIYSPCIGTVNSYNKGGYANVNGEYYYNLYDVNATPTSSNFDSSLETLKNLYDYVKGKNPAGTSRICLQYGLDDNTGYFVKEIGFEYDVTPTTTFEQIKEDFYKVSNLKYICSGATSFANIYKSVFNKYIEEIDINEDTKNKKSQFYIQHGANAGEDMLISYDCLSNDYLGLNNTNVLTREDSSQAITDIQEAVKKVSAQRSQFGAYQNRLEYVTANNANYSENLQNAESNLRDTDMAKEMVSYSKNSILEQAAQAMISQANQQNQGMLQLLQ